MAAFGAVVGAACWRGGTRAWEDLGRPAVPARTRQWGYAAVAVPVVIALPGAILGAGYFPGWLGAALAAAGIYAWRRYYDGSPVAPDAPEIVPAAENPPATAPGPERLH